MDLYAVNIISGTSIAKHMSLLQAGRVEHIQDLLSEFYDVTTCAHRLLWSLPIVRLWVEFRTQHHDFLVTRAPGWDGPKFQAQGPSVTISIDLFRREEFE